MTRSPSKCQPWRFQRLALPLVITMRLLHTTLTFSSPENLLFTVCNAVFVHLTGAPYHPATNGATERLLYNFAQAMKKSSLPTTHLKRLFDAVLPNTLACWLFVKQTSEQQTDSYEDLRPVAFTCSRCREQAKEATKSQENKVSNPVASKNSIGDPCYAL